MEGHHEDVHKACYRVLSVCRHLSRRDHGKECQSRKRKEVPFKHVPSKRHKQWLQCLLGAADE